MDLAIPIVYFDISCSYNELIKRLVKLILVNWCAQVKTNRSSHFFEEIFKSD